ncbi:AraC family transcriptional regulator [Terricaulis silvestris]|uniref:Right origin-binding protein n=1 Tax=Terricaulis silvestris TaxID=2686094 RepID=A0A6I6MG08_9CAUL|nr:AraC family transcriptional regulator [Terricaulis silvestris]QGZ93470.1 Right origin-binding protein [Terricaulis silvestris]
MGDPVEKALWFIESHFETELSADDVARVAGVSRFHLSRLFALTIGQSVMRYARRRRLSEAARALAAGAPDILTVALAHGYGSHEAFTRAFRDQFGVTPDAVRARGSLDGLDLQEPLRMYAQTNTELSRPRFETLDTLLVAGLGARYAQGGDPAIPLQWQRFGPHIGHIQEQVGSVAYGVIANFDDDNAFDYIAGVEVSRFADLPKDFTSLRIPARGYAVFTHKGHVSSIPATMRAIWQDWLPTSGHKFADAPFFERYDNRFDPNTGAGEVELWLPLES